jgi:hypothetical protein
LALAAPHHRALALAATHHWALAGTWGHRLAGYSGHARPGGLIGRFAALGPSRLEALLRLGFLDFRLLGPAACDPAQSRQSLLNLTEHGFELLNFALRPLTGLGLGADGGGGDVDPRSVPLCLLSNLRACLQAPGFFSPCLRACLGAPGLRARAFFAPLALAGLRARAFFELLALAELFLAALDHAPFDFAAVAIALLGLHRRNFHLSHFLGDHLGNVRVAARGQFVGDSLSH